MKILITAPLCVHFLSSLEQKPEFFVVQCLVDHFHYYLYVRWGKDALDFCLILSIRTL